MRVFWSAVVISTMKAFVLIFALDFHWAATCQHKMSAERQDDFNMIMTLTYHIHRINFCPCVVLLFMDVFLPRCCRDGVSLGLPAKGEKHGEQLRVTSDLPHSLLGQSWHRSLHSRPPLPSAARRESCVAPFCTCSTISSLLWPDLAIPGAFFRSSGGDGGGGKGGRYWWERVLQV